VTDGWQLAPVGARLLLLGLGVGTTAIGYRAYRRNPSAYLRNASLGVGFITLGVLVEGFLFQVTALTLTQVQIVEPLALACGLGVLLLSFLR
jgi:hypothetical protein